MFKTIFALAMTFLLTSGCSHTSPVRAIWMSYGASDLGSRNFYYSDEKGSFLQALEFLEETRRKLEDYSCHSPRQEDIEVIRSVCKMRTKWQPPINYRLMAAMCQSIWMQDDDPEQSSHPVFYPDAGREAKEDSTRTHGLLVACD